MKYIWFIFARQNFQSIIAQMNWATLFSLNQGENIKFDVSLKVKFWGHHGQCEIEF